MWVPRPCTTLGTVMPSHVADAELRNQPPWGLYRWAWTAAAAAVCLRARLLRMKTPSLQPASVAAAYQ
jgi:hypothetical protein